MTNQPHPTDPDLLSLCAILRSFDRNLLLALTRRDAAEIDTFLASMNVVSDVENAGMFQLNEGLQERILSRLRSEQPLTEQELHTSAFKYFLHQIERRDERFLRIEEAEDRYFYHLETLFEFLADRREWSTIGKHIEVTRTAKPYQQRHINLLCYYESHVLIYTKKYIQGEILLINLLDQPELDNKLRVRILNTLGHAQWFQTRYDLALAWYQGVYDLSREIGDVPFQSRGLLNMSMVLKEIGYYDRATDLLMQSLQVSCSLMIGMAKLTLSTRLATTQCNLGAGKWLRSTSRKL